MPGYRTASTKILREGRQKNNERNETEKEEELNDPPDPVHPPRQQPKLQIRNEIDIKRRPGVLRGWRHGDEGVVRNYRIVDN